MFQLTAARRRLDGNWWIGDTDTLFQLTAARRRLAASLPRLYRASLFQLTAARRRLVLANFASAFNDGVSTHSRPKAAGSYTTAPRSTPSRFNSQPPEGGWLSIKILYYAPIVSTHSRPKAAGRARCKSSSPSTPFQLTAARRRLACWLHFV